jgi:hypothetical protein
LHHETILSSTGNGYPHTMPTTFRLLMICATAAAMIYGAIYALANFLEPQPRDVTIDVPPAKFAK